MTSYLNTSLDTVKELNITPATLKTALRQWEPLQIKDTPGLISALSIVAEISALPANRDYDEV